MMIDRTFTSLMTKKTFFILSVLLINFAAFAQSNDDCLMCHEDQSLTTVRNGKVKSLYVKPNALKNTVHQYVECASCHKDAAVTDFPHPEKLKKVNCGDCHALAQKEYKYGVHGKKSVHSPDCKECHGTHDVLSPASPKSRTYKMNIPVLCGKCHKEGAPVARAYNITEHNIIENYSQDIHGKGLFKSGLTVTATCNNCHGNHLILPHNNRRSTIFPKNIAKTCMQCHARIEDVHKKVINGELWENKPGDIPSCTACHPPHKVNMKNMPVKISDQACLKCHGKDDIYKTVNGEKISLKVNPVDLATHMHKNITCVKCHTSVSDDKDKERPCETVKKVDCSNCHAEVSEIYFASGHGQAYFRKDKNAPYCTDCHGTHKVNSKDNDTSSTYRTNIPKLCGGCHKTDGKAVKNAKLKEINAYVDYSLSIHGKGLIEKGLTVSAICTDCHTTHFMLKETDERSSVHPNNIPSTCGSCHKGIYNEYIKSDHAINKTHESGKKYPTCADCHSAHMISEIDQDKFMKEITHQCGQCHEELAETYLETYHGKAYQLGYFDAAKCSDCHGAHNILNKDNPNSTIGILNIVSTCQKCHPGAGPKFASYLSHATHDDDPVLYYTFWFMTILLVGVFGFFGLHLILWLPRSFKERKRKHHVKQEGTLEYVRRFTRAQRVTHIFVIISFIILAFTGMLLKFAHMEWAKNLAVIVGGVKTAGVLHRFGAVITFGYFIFHLASLIRLKIVQRISIWKLVFGKDSLMFNMQDIRDFVATIKWFVGAGPRPKYGRWTYWEKFDYMAVFWGVAVIGFSGLVLWFPEFFTKFFPGWLINVCQIIHSDEALLAVGFIFTIHFFNTHFRPEAFPMDTVIFTGHIPLEEFKEDRPREYEELVKSGRIKKVLVKKEISKLRMKTIRTFGFIFLILGFTLVGFIIYSLIMGGF